MNTNETPPQDGEARSIDVKKEYAAFSAWARNTLPDSRVPDSSSNLFGSWMASARLWRFVDSGFSA